MIESVAVSNDNMVYRLNGMIGDDQVLFSIIYTWSSNFSAVHTSIVVKPIGRTVIIIIYIPIHIKYTRQRQWEVDASRSRILTISFFSFTILYSYNIITTTRRPWRGTQLVQLARKTSIPARLFRLGNDQ